MPQTASTMNPHIVVPFATGLEAPHALCQLRLLLHELQPKPDITPSWPVGAGITPSISWS